MSGVHTGPGATALTRIPRGTRWLASDLERGFLLLTDLGTRTYLDALDAQSAPALYRDACSALIRWQRASRDGVLRAYDRAILKRELDLFPDWYVAKHLGLVLSPGQKATLAEAFAKILDNNLAQPRVFVHRDYHPGDGPPLPAY